MTLTAHFINNDWKYENRILSFCLVLNHKGETIGRKVEEILREWGIRNVSIITVDNELWITAYYAENDHNEFVELWITVYYAENDHNEFVLFMELWITAYYAENDHNEFVLFMELWITAYYAENDHNEFENRPEDPEMCKHGLILLILTYITKILKNALELENPFILIHDKKIFDMNSLLKVLELSVTNKRPLLVVAEDVDSDALAMLILNKHRAGLKVINEFILVIFPATSWFNKLDYWFCFHPDFRLLYKFCKSEVMPDFPNVCAIKAPGFGDNRRAALDDLAILTGGEVAELLSYMLAKSWRILKLKTRMREEEYRLFSMHSSKLLEQDNLNLGFDVAQVKRRLFNYGAYSAKTGTYVDMVKAGIIDPIKIVRTALVDVASVSLLVTTIEASIVENMSDKNKPPQRVANMDDLDY
ncbi:hypothetical protein KIW84_041271 [Lathyrus oleraceus]|uniref:Uncharacterized protein n=1 Tax=Pisum sativum TaxID=3888 RepID=A0A9D4XCI6_PEA|nr:hypothetical protein KIW84_041271 [Pisum sativum]